MKRIFTIGFLSVIIFTSFSASAQLKSYVSLYGGFSNPVGAYGSNNYNNNEAGFANRGVTIGVDGAVYIHKNLAIGYIFSFQDQGKLNFNNTYILAQGYTTSYNADETTVNAYDRFHNWNLLVGPQYSFTYKDFILDLRAFGGVVDVTSTPETEIVLTGIEQQTDAFYQRRSHGYSFGYGGSAGLRYKLSDSWSFGIKAAYISADGTNVNIDGQTYQKGRLVTKIPIREFQTTAGFSLSF
jgi:opacity protein-like surface antigen